MHDGVGTPREMVGDPRRSLLDGFVRAVSPCMTGWTVYGAAVARESESDLWQIVDFQLDKSVTSWQFTVNLGLHDAALETVFPEWPRLNTRKPSIGACQIRVRLGELIDGRDRWWPLGSEAAFETLRSELCSTLAKVATPDLERFRSRQGIADAWMGGSGSRWFAMSNRMVLAGLLKQVGRKPQATDVAAAEVAESADSPREPWARTVAARLK